MNLRLTREHRKTQGDFTGTVTVSVIRAGPKFGSPQSRTHVTFQKETTFPDFPWCCREPCRGNQRLISEMELVILAEHKTVRGGTTDSTPSTSSFSWGTFSFDIVEILLNTHFTFDFYHTTITPGRRLRFPRHVDSQMDFIGEYSKG